MFFYALPGPNGVLPTTVRAMPGMQIRHCSLEGDFFILKVDRERKTMEIAMIGEPDADARTVVLGTSEWICVALPDPWPHPQQHPTPSGGVASKDRFCSPR